MTVDPYRLPRSVTPVHYDLTIAPDLGACRFDVTTSITVEGHEPVTESVLNAVELDVTEGTTPEAGGRVQAGTVTLDAGLERATVTFPEVVAAGEATLALAA